MTTDLVDFLVPSNGLSGDVLTATAPSFSFSSLVRVTTGDAGIVVSLFFSGAAVLRKFDEDSGRDVLDVVVGTVRVADVEGAFRVPIGLVTMEREVGVGVFRLTGVAVVFLSDERSVTAKDILFGFAVMPSFLDSSMEAWEGCF